MNDMINDVVMGLNNIGRVFCDHAGSLFVQSSALSVLRSCGELVRSVECADRCSADCRFYSSQASSSSVQVLCVDACISEACSAEFLCSCDRSW